MINRNLLICDYTAMENATLTPINTMHTIKFAKLQHFL